VVEKMKRYNIAMIHYKIQATDGVSLEMNKWAKIFEDMGHKVFMLGAEIGNNGRIIHPSLHHTSDVAKALYNYSFVNKEDFKDDDEYKKTMLDEAAKAERVIESFVVENSIDLVIPQNVWSVAMNPSVAIALERVVERHRLKVLAQHHDFFWERIGGVNYSCKFAEDVADRYLPPKNPSYHHVVINQQGHDTLLKKRGLESTVVPNVFDFEMDEWKIDDYNRDFKESLNISEDDVIFLQATRIVERKGIELAIDLIRTLNDRKPSLIGKTLYDGRIIKENTSFILLCVGYSSDDGTGTYVDRLKDRAKRAGVNIQFADSFISHDREISDENKKYSLWDSYVFADIITYPSYWEGWGNQFLEGLFAEVPMVVYEYPVFVTDIKKCGFDYISLGMEHTTDPITHLIDVDHSILDSAADKSIRYLLDASFREKNVRRNFEIGKNHYSMQTLRKYLENLIEDLD
jgi:glycosyltransferase involved in cell wall biosynthesis